MTNAFAQSLAFAALAAAVLWPLRRGDWHQIVGLTALTAWAMLSHISTLTLLGAILFLLAALYWFRPRSESREPALALFGALATAAVLSSVLYYGHFGDAYRSAMRVRADPAASQAAAPGSGTAAGAAAPAATPVSLPSKIVGAGQLAVAAVGWPIFLLALVGVVPFWRRALSDRLGLAVVALAITFTLFIISVVVAPVERSFQRYAAEFISRVTLATYPAMVILGGLGAAWAWRAGWPARSVAAGLMAWAIYVGADTWIGWLR